MANQQLDIGTEANDDTGDPIRTGAIKINSNFTEIYNALGNNTTIQANTKTLVANAVLQPIVANTNARIALVNTNLTGTNTSLRTLISDRAQVANVAVQTTRVTLVNSNLTGTNTALRTLISDRAQVANVAALAALGNTNARIALVNTNLTGTNTAVRTLINDRLQVANGAILTTNNDFTSTNQQRLGAPILTSTANAYTMAAADAGKYHRLNYANSSASGSTSVTVTIPNNSSVAIPIGSEYLFVRTGSNSPLNFANAAGVTLNSEDGKKAVNAQFKVAICKKNGTNEWDLSGNLSS